MQSQTLMPPEKFGRGSNGWTDYFGPIMALWIGWSLTAEYIKNDSWVDNPYNLIIIPALIGLPIFTCIFLLWLVAIYKPNIIARPLTRRMSVKVLTWQCLDGWLSCITFPLYCSAFLVLDYEHRVHDAANLTKWFLLYVFGILLMWSIKYFVNIKRKTLELSLYPNLRMFGTGRKNLFQFDPTSGEWQRIISWGNKRTGPRLDLRPRSERVQNELLFIDLRKQLWARHTMSTVAGILAECVLIYTIEHDSNWVILAICWILVVAIGYAGCWRLPITAWIELLYQTGNQSINGAKVLDPEPTKGGFDPTNQQIGGQSTRPADIPPEKSPPTAPELPAGPPRKSRTI